MAFTCLNFSRGVGEKQVRKEYQNSSYNEKTPRKKKNGRTESHIFLKNMYGTDRGQYII